MQDLDLLGHEGGGAEHHVLAHPAHASEVLEGREVVAELPDDVGQEDEEGHSDREPGPGRAQLAPRPREDEGRAQGQAEEHRRVLVHQAEAGEEAEEEPGAPITTIEDPQQDEHRSHPQQRLEGVHGEEAVGAEVDGCHGHGQSSQGLREGAAQPARDERGQHDQGPARQRREQTQHGERSAQEQRETGDQADHRRMIDVAPVQVAAAVEEVELVAEVSVAMGEQEVDEGQTRGNPDDRNPGETHLPRRTTVVVGKFRGRGPRGLR